jgi:hypothetical protein
MAKEVEKDVAHHEAGHMVAAWKLGLTVTGVTLIPDPEEGYVGAVWVPVEERVRYADWVHENEYLYAHVVTYYAGIVAGEIYTDTPLPDTAIKLATGSSGSDHYNADDLILSIAGLDRTRRDEVRNAAQQRRRTRRGCLW